MCQFSQIYNRVMALHYRPLNILRMIDGIRPNFAYALLLTRSRLRIYSTVMALGYCQNFISAQCRVKKLMKFEQVLYIHW